MNLEEAKNQILDAMDAGMSIELKSSPGVGKSELIDQLRDELSKRDGEPWGFSKMFLATQTPSDMIGYIFKGEMNHDGENIPISEATMPLWMITDEGKPTSAYKRGILFLDEYGQGEADTKRASAELLLNKQLGPWKLGGKNQSGWVVIAASNRSEDRSGVTKQFDFVINRRMEINITPALDPWLKWADKNGVTPLTKAFCAQNPQVVFDGKVPEKQEPWATPRSVVKLDKLMQVKEKRMGHFPDDPHTIEAAHGIIGAAASAQYFAFVRLEREMPKFEAIVKKPDTVKVPEKPDAQMLVVYNLAHRVDADTLTPVITYIERMPKEFAVTFVKSVCHRDSQMLAEPAMHDWATRNASLVSLMAA